jgi:NTP pyrophosphatase (non-canonical NTP hydrolase)
MITPETIAAINTRMQHSVAKYGPLEDQCRALGALVLEVHEAVEAMHARANDRVYEELLDVANVAIRFAQEIRSGDV